MNQHRGMAHEGNGTFPRFKQRFVGFLIGHFGDAYRAYMARTRRLLPGLY